MRPPRTTRRRGWPRRSSSRSATPRSPATSRSSRTTTSSSATIYEGELAELCEREGIACIPYFALARGFLSGKYRPGGAEVDSPRAERARTYLDERGIALLELLDEIAAAHDTTVAAVSIAWLRMQPTVVAPIASARNPSQLAESLPGATLELTPEELDRLSSAAAYSERS